MRESVCILAHKYLDNTGDSLHIGGVETIVGVLAQHLHQSYNITVLQLSTKQFTQDLDGIRVLGFRREKELRMHYIRHFQSQVSFSVFLTYPWGGWIRGEKAFVFQHGIVYDGFFSRRTGLSRALHKMLVRYRRRGNRIVTRHILDRSYKVLCVDLNFINWVRATFPFERWEHKLVYLPNFSPQAPKEIILRKANEQKQKSDLHVIIPRRFEPPRGVLLMARIAVAITKIRPNVHFHFIGDGSQRQELEQLLHGNKHCKIQTVSHSEMLEQYLESDISVIPTLWSEGTSLSCIESMSYGCSVLATTVGGLGNLVFHNYNGSLSSPQSDCIFKELLRLIDDAALRKRYIENGLAVVSSSFSKEHWLRNIENYLGVGSNVEL